MMPPGFDFRGLNTFDELNLLLKYYQVDSSAVPIDADIASSKSIYFVGRFAKEEGNKWAIALKEVERRATAHGWGMVVLIGPRCVTSQNMPLLRHFRALVQEVRRTRYLRRCKRTLVQSYGPCTSYEPRST